MSWRSSSVAVLAALLTACASSSDGDGAAPTSSARDAVAAVITVAAPTTPSASSAPAAAVTAAPSTTAPSTVAPTPVAPTVTPTTGVAPAGYERVAGRVTAADESTCDVCLWLAATPGARAQGLMGVTDLSGADGMVFRWDEATAGSFWMRNTPLPLSIAFFAADGTFVSSTDMTPCLPPTPDADCASYPAAGPYQYAVEVAAGGLPALLMETGSRLEVFDAPCPPSS